MERQPTRYFFAQFNWETKKVFGTNVDEVTITAVESRKKDQLAKRWVLDRVRRNEFAGVLRNSYGTVFTEQIAKMNIDLQLNTRGFSVAQLDRGLLVASYRDFVADSLGTYLPSAVIPTELYALYEHDASRKLTSNDWNDWQHASVALPYCDFFFTERHLAHQLTKILGMWMSRYHCIVACTLEGAIEALASI